VLLKDNIAAAGTLNATAGSIAMVGSRPARDAGVVERLRNAGAVLLGTASLSEWCNFRGPGIPAGWSPRGGQGKLLEPNAVMQWPLILPFWDGDAEPVRAVGNAVFLQQRLRDCGGSKHGSNHDWD